MRAVAVFALSLALAACGQHDSSSAKTAPPPGGPVETQPPNGKGQSPAFPGQTRAPLRTTKTAFEVQTVASGLENPWCLAFLSDGRLLVTERPGRLRLVEKGGALSPPVEGLPAVEAKEQGGLLDLALDPAFDRNHLIYFTYLEPRPKGSGIAVARGKLIQAGGKPRLEAVKVIFRAEPGVEDDKNVGSRLVFAPDGNLFVTIGDRFKTRDKAQTLDNDLGKVVRITPEGGVPPANPFVNRPGARPEIWSYGHRNPEAAAINPKTDRLWVIEHGAKGGDELNIPQGGKNYGWPVITYGVDYSGAPIGEGTQKPGMEQPAYYWDPVIAPSGMAFYEGEKFPAWKGSLFVGSLRGRHLARLTLNGDRVVGEERLLVDLGERIRDVRVGPDGLIYLLTDNPKGRILRLAPKA